MYSSLNVMYFKLSQCSPLCYPMFPPTQLVGSTSPGGSSEGSGIDLIIILAVLLGLALLFLCTCICCYRNRKGKEGRADQMRRNLGYTPDMESKGEGNFGPTNKHVAITRGDRTKPTPEMLATKSFQPNYAVHHRAPSEAPSSIIEDNIANNYVPKKAAKVRAEGDGQGARGEIRWRDLCGARWCYGWAGSGAV